MKKIILSMVLLSTLATSQIFADNAKNALAAATPSTSPFATDQEKLSYVIGFNVGTGLHAQQIGVDQKVLEKGITDGLTGTAPAMQPAEMQTVMMNFQKTMVAKHEAQIKMEATKNLADGQAFMKANAAKPGVKSIANGQIQYRIITEGKGSIPKLTDKVEFTYVGKLVNGSVFDASKDNGGKPVSLALNQMIPGMQKILAMMPVGSTWEVVVAPSMAYGPQGVPMSPIGPNETLVFTLTVKGITHK